MNRRTVCRIIAVLAVCVAIGLLTLNTWLGAAWLSLAVTVAYIAAWMEGRV